MEANFAALHRTPQHAPARPSTPQHTAACLFLLLVGLPATRVRFFGPVLSSCAFRKGRAASKSSLVASPLLTSLCLRSDGRMDAMRQAKRRGGGGGE